MADIREEVLAACAESRAAATVLRQLSRSEKDAAIAAIAEALLVRADDILAANREDVAAAREAGLEEAMVDRLVLDLGRLTAIAEAAREVCALPDPVGTVVRGFTLPNGLELRQVRVPLGVVAMIYEARPNVTVDAAVLCLKSGNAALLRGSSSAARTNAALVDAMQSTIEQSGLPAAAISMVPGLSHDSVDALMKARGLVDVIIPRGGAGLIDNVVKNSTVPVIETGVGNCHIFIDVDADFDMALDLIINSKTHRVSVCNSLETVLVHSEIADEFLPLLAARLAEARVSVHGSPEFEAPCDAAGADYVPATDEDWAKEYLSLDVAANVVADIDAAIAHVQKWSSGHTDAIVTESLWAADRFVKAIDSAAVMVNASTRFTDGGEFGFGAEIGISTQKLHARGPMGLSELTSTKYIVTGQGQTRA